MTGVLTGGITGRYIRQLLATALMGLIFVGTGAVRWAEHAPLRGAVLIAGVVSLSAVASLLGRTSRTARTFLALFLFGLYMITNARDVPLLDWFGSNGVANSTTLSLQIAITFLLSLAGIIFSRSKAN